MEPQSRIDELNALLKSRDEKIERMQGRLMETDRLLKAKDDKIDVFENMIHQYQQSRVLRAVTLIRRLISMRPAETIRIFKSKLKKPINIKPATLGLNQEDYEKWKAAHALTPAKIGQIQEAISAFAYKPLISIVVPVYNVDEKWLNRAIVSVQNQLYEKWELCMADDASTKPHVAKLLTQHAERDSRIKVKILTDNGGIALASNHAAALATGEYIGLLDHDDELSRDALYECVKVLNDDSEIGLIYSDEDKLDMTGRRIEPFFKPDYSPDLLMSQNYICHFSVMQRTLFEKIGGFRQGFDGSQDHDLLLRITEKTEKIYHIAKILYHWRKIPGSTAAVYDSKSYAWEAGRRAIEDATKRRDIPGHVFKGKFQGCYRVKRNLVEQPLVSIIIPFKDHPELLEKCIGTILEKSTYSHFEIIGVSNNSRDDNTFALMKRFGKSDQRFQFFEYNIPFNFSKINNFAARKAEGKHLLLLNNDIEIITPDWIECLLEHSQRPEVGAVGGRLYYEDFRIQHAGLITGLFGNAGVCHKLFHKDNVGYYAKTHIIHNVSAVTGACLMVKKDLYDKVEGLDEIHLGVAYNDVDFCLKLWQADYVNVFTPYCEAIHYESVSRGYEDTPEKAERFHKERAVFEARWEEVIAKGDPYYNTQLTLKSEDYKICI